MLLKNVHLFFLLILKLAVFLAPLLAQNVSVKNTWAPLKINYDTLKNKISSQFLIVATSPESLEAVYAATIENKIYYTKNLGRSWRDLDFHGAKINNLVLNPNRAGDLFVCTNQGVYFKSEQDPSWHHIYEALQNLEVYALAYQKIDTNIVYVATEEGIKISTDGGQAWLTIAASFRKGTSRKTNALLVSSQTNPWLYIGTDDGIYKCNLDMLNSIEATASDLDEKIKINAFAACAAADSFAVLAATETHGILWGIGSRREWLPINAGMKRPLLPILNLTCDEKTSTTAYAVLQNGQVLKYKFAGIRVGMFAPFSSIHSPAAVIPTEMRRIADRLYQQLSAPHVLELVRLDSSLNATTAIQQIDAILNYGKINSYDKLIGIDLAVVPSLEKDAHSQDMVLEAKAVVFNMTGEAQKRYRDYPKTQNWESYYPGLIDELALEIRKNEFGIVDEPLCKKTGLLKRYLKNDCIIFFCGGIAGAIVVRAFFWPDPENKTVLPFPPPFPSQDKRSSL